MKHIACFCKDVFTVRHSGNINPPGSNVSADQQPHFFSLKTPQISVKEFDFAQLSAFSSCFYLKALQVVLPLIRLSVAMETNAGKLVTFIIWA